MPHAVRPGKAVPGRAGSIPACGAMRMVPRTHGGHNGPCLCAVRKRQAEDYCMAADPGQVREQRFRLTTPAEGLRCTVISFGGCSTAEREARTRIFEVRAAQGQGPSVSEKRSRPPRVIVKNTGPWPRGKARDFDSRIGGSNPPGSASVRFHAANSKRANGGRTIPQSAIRLTAPFAQGSLYAAVV